MTEALTRLFSAFRGRQSKKGARTPFVVPDHLLRNAGDVLAAGKPADLGVTLISYMCDRLGVGDLSAIDVLDVGCGTRFTDSIINRRVAIKSYTGIDVNPEIIEFLKREARDPRLSYYHLAARNPLYNPQGTPLTPDAELPASGRFGLICMFSVITHQLPDDAKALFSILRRHIQPGGHLFFSADLRDSVDGYAEGFPDKPTTLSIYSPTLMRKLLTEAGWRIVSVEAKSPRGLAILDSILCVPN